MRQLVFRLVRSSFVRQTGKFLRLHHLANAWLRCFPVQKVLPGSGVRYRASRIESIALSVEMFDQSELYSLADLPENIETYADLGCNVGYFTCWLTHKLGGKKIKGIMVDANPEAVKEARWHAEANQLKDVHAVHGLAGLGNGTATTDFYLHTSNICSTSSPPEGALKEANTWKQVQVPCVNLEELWQRYFQGAPCDLLKMDIEGSELDFLKNEPAFVKRARAILVEWHKWRVTLPELEAFLTEQGFRLKKITSEDANFGTALFVRVS
jgi:FkbM family methyltransferase